MVASSASALALATSAGSPSVMVAEVAGGATAVLTVAGAWWDLRRRTNGKGPIGSELKAMREEQDRQGLILRDLIRWQVDHLNDHLERK